MELDQRTEIVEGDDRPLLRKWAITAAGRLALAREADRLERARHPGVVSLAAIAEDHLDLEWAGAETLALARLTRGSAARIVTVVAATVADLHDRGIVHGRIDETHVVIGPHLQPQLCGLRGSDPGRPEPGPADDVADLGLLLQQAIRMGADPDLVPEQRWRAWPRGGGGDRSLEAIAERATDPDPARRPTARALARSLADLVPNTVGALREPDTDRTSTRGPSPTPSPSPSRPESPIPEVRSAQETLTSPGSSTPPGIEPDRRTAGDRGEPTGVRPPHPRPARVPGARLMAGAPTRLSTSRGVSITSDVQPAADPAPHQEPFHREVEATAEDRRPVPLRVIAGVGLVVALGAVLAIRQPAARPAATFDVVPSPTAGQASIVIGRPSPTTTPVAPTSAPDRGGSRQAPTVEFDGATYEVGAAGDDVELADWDCDGTVTVGLVRPTTGEVFLFDSWPGDEEVTVHARARIAGARELVAPRPGADCRGTEVRLDDGTTVMVMAEAGG